MFPIRICLPDYQILMQVKPDTSATGVLAPFMHLFMDQVRGLNASARVEPRVGSLAGDGSDGRYDGCLGFLQSNESDLLVAGFVDLPLPGDNLTIGAVDAVDRIGIFSAYKRREVTDIASKTQVLDMMLAFEPSLWLLVIGSFVALTLVLLLILSFKASEDQREVEVRIQRKKEPVISSLLVANVMKQYSSLPLLPSRDSVRLATASLVLLSFYAIFYLTSMIKTEMVVVKPPITVESYAELLASGMRPTWPALFTDSNEFRDAAPDSLEHNVWLRAVEMGINQSLIHTNTQEMMTQGEEACHFKSVMIFKSFLGYPWFPLASCSWMRVKHTFPDVNTLFRSDPSSRERLRVNVRNQLLPRSVARQIDLRIRRRFAAGLEAALIRSVDLIDALGLTEAERAPFYSSIADCASNVVTIPSPESYAVVLSHFASLFGLCFTGVAVAALVAVLEAKKKSTYA